MILKTVLVIILLFLGQIKEENLTIQLINFGSFLMLGSFMLSNWPQKHILKYASLILLIYLMLIYSALTIPFINKASNFSTDEPIGCTSDTQDFLKTFYIMKQGTDYYHAFSSALVNCGGFQQAPKDSTSWRLPTSFYLWKLFSQNGQQIRMTFYMFSLMAMLCSYLLMKKVTNYKIALLAPYLIIPYFIFTMSGDSFMFTEWWGLFFLIFGLTAIFYEKRNLSLGLLIISVLCRELFIVPALAILIVDFLKHRKILHLIIFLSIVAFFWTFHLKNISNTIGQVNFSPQSRIHNFDKTALLSALAFSTKTYKFVFLRIGTLLPAITIIGLIRFFFLAKNEDKKYAYFGLSSFFVLILLAPFIVTRAMYEGVFQYADYWGIIFVPMAIIFSPLILFRKDNSSESLSEKT